MHHPRTRALGMAGLVAIMLAVLASCSLLDVSGNPCPESSAPLVCPDHACCPVGMPYECNGKCWASRSACASGFTLCTETGGASTVPAIAGVSQSSGAFSGIIVTKGGEVLAPMVARDASGAPTRLTGLVYASPDGLGITVHLGADGLPTDLVVGDYILLFHGWDTAKGTVDLAKIYAPTSRIEIFRGVKDAAITDLASGIAPASGDVALASTCWPRCDSAKKNLAMTFEIAALALSASACAVATSASFEALLLPCTGALFHAASVLGGDEPWLEDAENAGLVLAGIGCLEANILDCTAGAYAFIGNVMSNADKERQTYPQIFTDGNTMLADPKQGSGLARNGAAPLCTGQYECSPGSYMPCYPDGTRTCGTSCAWGACPVSSGGCPGVVDCASGTHQVGCDCVPNSTGGGGTCSNGEPCTGSGHVCCQCADGSIKCLLTGLCNLGC